MLCYDYFEDSNEEVKLVTHAHITTWVLALILFFISIGLHKANKVRGLKIVQMILRLFYILIIVTGAMMLFSLAVIPVVYWVKAILGILVIAFFELVLTSMIKGKSTGLLWVILIVLFIAVVYLGFYLPLGFKFF